MFGFGCQASGELQTSCRRFELEQQQQQRLCAKREGKLGQIRIVLSKAGKNAGRGKREFYSLPVKKDDRKDSLFIFVVRTARNRLKGRMVSRLSRGFSSDHTLRKTSLERMKPLLCWVGNQESNQTAALDCDGISMLWPKEPDLKPQELDMHLQLWSLRFTYTYATFPMEMLLLTLVQVLTPGRLHQWVYWASASHSVMELFASNSSRIFIPVLD